MKRILSKTSQPIFIACACIIVILIIGAAINPNFLSANYLLLQLEVASFLGIVAAGAMLVILLGHIDLSARCRCFERVYCAFRADGQAVSGQ